jgi:Yip1 domain
MGTSDAGSMTQDQPPMGFGSRFLGVFMSPGETFDDIARKPDIVVPLLVNILATVAFSECMLAKIGMDRIVRMQLEQSGRMSSMSPDQVEQAVSRGAKYGAIVTHVIGVLGSPVFLLIVAAVGMGIVSAIFGSKIKFGLAFSTACYANLVSVLGVILGIIVMFMGDPEHFNPSAPIPTNLGFFLDPIHTSKALYAIATSLDLFTIWLMALLGIGFSAATRRKAKPVSVFLSFLVLWAVVVLIKVGWASIG